MPELKEALNLGDLLKYEDSHLYSRERVTLVVGQTLPLGAVVGLITASGKVMQLDPSATDGSQVAAGVLIQPCDAALAERNDGLMVARHAIVADHALTWPTGITAGEQAAAIVQLKALGVLVRPGR
jgi:hypothetical protein